MKIAFELLSFQSMVRETDVSKIIIDWKERLRSLKCESCWANNEKAARTGLSKDGTYDDPHNVLSHKWPSQRQETEGTGFCTPPSRNYKESYANGDKETRVLCGAIYLLLDVILFNN